MTSTKLTAALAAADRGWFVFPAATNRKIPAGGLTEWERRATTDATTVKRWWRRHPDRNIAIAAGPSGLVVLDLDTRKPNQMPPARRGDLDNMRGGLDVLVALADANSQPLPPETYTVRTASGGWHLYYRTPADAALRNTCGRIGWLIDTRAGGGYVIGAGSTIGGRAYRLMCNRAELPELPAWLHDLSAPPAPTSRPVAPPSQTADGYAGAALAAEINRVRTACNGGRNWALNKAAWNLSRFIAAGDLTRSTVQTELQSAGEAVGLRPAEVAATIHSAITNGMRRHPRVAS